MMRLSELYVDGFGILNALHLGREDLGQGLTVIYGMNEAGKSTLMAFIQAILFGFKVKDSYGGEPLRGGRLGGYLVFTNDKGEDYRVDRVPRGRRGRVTVSLPDGKTGNETFLQEQILKSITPLVFRNVFALGMDDLRRLEELGASEVSAHVYGAGAGLRAGSLSAGISRLEEEMNNLFRPGGAKPPINQLLKGLQEVEVVLRGLQREPEEYGMLKKEIAFLRSDRKKLEREKNEVELAKRRLEAVNSARESWVCLQEALERLTLLPSIEAFPESGVERLTALERQLRELKLSRAETVKQMEALRGRMDQLNINKLLIEHAAEIKTLAGEQVLQLERLRQLPGLAFEVEHAAAEYQELERKLGCAYDWLQLKSIDTSLPAREIAASYNEKLAAAGERLKRTREVAAYQEIKVGEKEADLARAESALAEQLAQAHSEGRPLAKREKSLDILDAGLRRIALIRNNLAQQRERLKDLVQQKEDIKGELEAKPFRFLSGWYLLVLLVLLAALITAAFLSSKTTGFLALSAGLAVLALVGQAAHRHKKIETTRVSRLEEALKNLQRRTAAAAAEIEQSECQEKALARELEEAARVALGRPEAREEEIPDARRMLEEEKRNSALAVALGNTCRQLASILEGEKQKKSAAMADMDDAQRQKAGLLQEWQGWLAKQGLPESLNPAGVIAFYDAVEEAARRYQTWQKYLLMQREARAQADAFLKRQNLLLAKIGQREAAQENACDQVARLEEDLSEAIRQDGNKMRLQEQIDLLSAESRRLEITLYALAEEVDTLLAEGGAANPEDFCHRAEIFRERKKTAGDVQTYERDLKVIAGSTGELILLEQGLRQSERAKNEQELNDLTGKIREMQDKINEAGEKIGQWDTRIKMMEKGDELAVQLQEKEMLKAALKSRAGEWQVRALCLRLLNMAKERHERQRQPAVLQQASTYISKMTDGAYNRVMAPAGRTDVLEVESSGGARIPLPALSRGTASQLYLSVRLALASQYSGVGLPVILDDILVDFDRDRLKGAVQVLGEFSRQRQVILFTCHEHVLGAFTGGLDNFGLVRLVVPGKSR